MRVMENRGHQQTKIFSEEKILTECREYFTSETEKTAEIGEKFMQYFLKNASSEGVLFKTIKQITTDMNISHQTLTKVLKTLESKQIIYRRNGIIGLWKE